MLRGDPLVRDKHGSAQGFMEDAKITCFLTVKHKAGLPKRSSGNHGKIGKELPTSLCLDLAINTSKKNSRNTKTKVAHQGAVFHETHVPCYHDSQSLKLKSPCFFPESRASFHEIFMRLNARHLHEGRRRKCEHRKRSCGAHTIFTHASRSAFNR